MRKTILSAAALLAVAAGQAQTGFGTQISVTSPTTDDNAARTAGTTAATVVPASEALPAGRSEWLAPFDAVEVDATVDIRFVEVPATEAPRIVYDTKGDATPNSARRCATACCTSANGPTCTVPHARK